MSLVFQSVPMCRLTLRMVRSTLVTAWFLADWPTRTSPFLAKATTEGVVREPSEFAITVGSPPSRTVTTELVVPRSIPTARAMEMASLPCAGWCWSVPVAGGSSLASGPLNFPAQLNGRHHGRVPGVATIRRQRRVVAGTDHAFRPRTAPPDAADRAVRPRAARRSAGAAAGARGRSTARDAVHRSPEGDRSRPVPPQAPDVHPVLRAHADRHLGLFTTADAVHAGYAPEEIRSQCRTGHWSRVRRGVLITAAELAEHERRRRRHRVDCLAALLSLGRPSAVVSHGSAARLWVFPVREDLDRTVRLTDPGEWRRGPGFVVSNAPLRRGEITVAGPLRLTSAARTL